MLDDVEFSFDLSIKVDVSLGIIPFKVQDKYESWTNSLDCLYFYCYNHLHDMSVDSLKKKVYVKSRLRVFFFACLSD